MLAHQLRALGTVGSRVDALLPALTTAFLNNTDIAGFSHRALHTSSAASAQRVPDSGGYTDYFSPIKPPANMGIK